MKWGRVDPDISTETRNWHRRLYSEPPDPVYRAKHVPLEESLPGTDLVEY